MLIIDTMRGLTGEKSPLHQLPTTRLLVKSPVCINSRGFVVVLHLIST